MRLASLQVAGRPCQTWEMRSHRLQSGSEQCHWCHTISRHNQHIILRHSMGTSHVHTLGTCLHMKYGHVACAHPGHMPAHEVYTAVHTYTLGSVYFPQCKTRHSYTCTEGRQQNTRCAKVTPWRYLALARAAGVARPGGRLAKRDAGLDPEVVWMGGTSSPRCLAADNTKHPQTPWGYGCCVAVAVHARALHQPYVHARQRKARCPRIPVCMTMGRESEQRGDQPFAPWGRCVGVVLARRRWVCPGWCFAQG